MSILAFYNIKGGVGKTTSCVNLAYLSAASGRMTLLCDLDPQGAASFYLRIRPAAGHSGKKLLKGSARIAKLIRGSDFERLDLLPADLSYRKLDILMDRETGVEKSLDKLLQPFRSEYAHIFLDCPPNITRFSEAIFQAADHIFVPLIPTTLSLLSYQKLLDFFRQYRYLPEKLHPFFSMVEQRKQLHRLIMEEPRLRQSVLTAFIPYLAEIEKMGVYRNPVCVQHPSSRAARAYTALWARMTEIIEKG